MPPQPLPAATALNRLQAWDKGVFTVRRPFPPGSLGQGHRRHFLSGFLSPLACFPSGNEKEVGLGLKELRCAIVGLCEDSTHPLYLIWTGASAHSGSHLTLRKGLCCNLWLLPRTPGCGKGREGRLYKEVANSTTCTWQTLSEAGARTTSVPEESCLVQSAGSLCPACR